MTIQTFYSERFYSSWNVDRYDEGNHSMVNEIREKSLQMVIAAMKLKDAYSLEGVTTNLDSILKSRDIYFVNKVHLVKAMVFTVVMYGCESWTIKKAEH